MEINLVGVVIEDRKNKKVVSKLKNRHYFFGEKREKKYMLQKYYKDINFRLQLLYFIVFKHFLLYNERSNDILSKNKEDITMAMNPMQRKANNYLLIGVLVTLLITGTIIGFLFIQLNKLQTERKTETSAMKEVFVVSTDINSGDTVSLDKLKKQSVASSMIPSNALTVGDITENTIAKIAVKKGSVITTDMVAESDAQTTDDVRVQEYNMVLLPTQIQTGDYVDIRLRMPTGEDFIVVSKKRVELPMIDGVDSYSSIKLQMSEEDTVVMSNAIVEAYIMKGSVLYAATYVEPGMQNGATTTYVPKATVQDLMYRNPNIVTEAKNALMTIYNANQSTRNNVINGGLSQYREEELDNIQEAVQEQINKAKEERQNYLESLGATY